MLRRDLAMESDRPDETIDAVIKKAEEEKDENFWRKNEKGTIKDSTYCI